MMHYFPRAGTRITQYSGVTMDALDMLTNKPEYDWDAYYPEGCHLAAEDKPMFWRCGCGETNATVVGEKARCVRCQVMAFSPQPLITPVL
jgi:hypothetical protein